MKKKPTARFGPISLRIFSGNFQIVKGQRVFERAEVLIIPEVSAINWPAYDANCYSRKIIEWCRSQQKE
jgi:hypothetical protein